MTYFGILLTFIAPPLIGLGLWATRDFWIWLLGRGPRSDWLPYQAVFLHGLIALIYTTPWDNYLVATGVWWYNPLLVTGIRFGWVPIEEYTFFVMQTLMTGFGLLLIRRYMAAEPFQPARRVRLWFSAAGWVAALGIWLSGWKAGTYLALILLWAFIPLWLQTAFGADILLAYRRSLLWAISLPTLYLWGVDILAIQWGTWTISPQQTTGIRLGVLPVEEMVFFFITNVLVCFGITLLIAPESRARLQLWFSRKGG